MISIFVVARLATWFYPFDSDHWIFWYIGKKIVDGGLPYISAWDHKPPLIFYFNALMHFLFGGNLALHRIFLTLLTILDIYLFWKLALTFSNKINKEKAHILAKMGLVFYVFFRNLSQFTSSGNNTENFGLIFLILTFLLFFEYQEKRKLWLLFASGICLSFLFFLKGNFLILALPIFVEILIENYKNIKNLLLKLGVFILPLILHSLFWIFYFKLKGIFRDFLIGSFLFNSEYVKAAWRGRVSANRLFFVWIQLSLFIPLFPFLVNLFKEYKKVFKDKIYRFLFFSLFGSIFFILGTGSFYSYYSLILMPFFSLLLIYNYEILLSWRNKKALALTLLLLLGAIFSWVISMKQFYNYFCGDVKADFEEKKRIAQYIKENSSPKDKIEAYDYGAVFYRLAQRDSGSRFISASVLLLDEREKFGFDFTSIFISELEKSKPKFFIILKEESQLYYQNKRVIDYMNSFYKISREFDNFLVLERRGEYI